jgi:hypothetical protein
MFPLIPFGAERYSIPFAVPLRPANGSFFTRTNVAAPTDNRKCTISIWDEWAAGTGSQALLGVDTGSAAACIRYNALASTQRDFEVGDPSYGAFTLRTNALFRDPTGHGHTLIQFDTTQATSANRLRIFRNGTQLTSFQTANYPALNSAVPFNLAGAVQALGRRHATSATWYYDGVAAEHIFVDGQVVDPESFGRAADGMWVPRRFVGTYGANGGWWRFDDATAATAAAIGKDSSGNGNNFTPSGISVAAGASFGQSLDTPSRNFCTMNPLTPGATGLSNGNLTVAGPTPNVLGTIGVSSGAWVFEGQIAGFPGSTESTGIGIRSNTGAQRYIRSRSADFAGTVSSAGETTGLAFWSTNDVARIEFDIDANRCAIYRNGTLVLESLAAGLAGQTWWPEIQAAVGGTWHFNFGARAWAQSPTAGYRAISTRDIASAAHALSGSFTGNASSDGPVVWLGGTPASISINGNAVIWGTHADKIAGGFKLRTSSASYNASGTNNWTATAGPRFAAPNRNANNAQVN